MPQMAPINWLILFIFFLLVLLLFSIKNFYLIYYLPKLSTIKKSLLNYNWKW